MRVLVMGGTRFMGPKVIATLVERGHDVTVFNRQTRPYTPPPGVRLIAGDRNDTDALAEVARHDYDAVVDMSAYLRSQTESLLDVIGAIDRWIHVSSGAVYQPATELPWPESTAYGPWSVWGAYALEKLGCERALQERRAIRQSTIALRFPVVLGPANYVQREEFVFNRLLDAAEILVPGDGHAVLQFLSIDQVGETVANAVELGTAGWNPYNIGNPTFASLVGFVDLCGEIAGVEPAIRYVAARSGAFDPYDAVFPFPNENYVLDTTASIANGLAPEPVTLGEMLQDAYEYLRAHPERRAWERTNAEKALLAPA